MQKNANLQRLFLKNPVYSKNVCKKNCPKNDKTYISEKPLIMLFKLCKKGRAGKLNKSKLTLYSEQNKY